MNNATKVLAALATGAALGAIAGILFAPAKGRDTRKKICRKADDLADAVKDTLEEGKEHLTRLHDELEGELSRIKDKLKNFV